MENEHFFNLVMMSSEQVNLKGEKFRTLVCNLSEEYRSFSDKATRPNWDDWRNPSVEERLYIVYD